MMNAPPLLHVSNLHANSFYPKLKGTYYKEVK